MQFFSIYQSLIDIVLINCCLAFSQYVVLRAGVFSLATSGIASIGAYTAAILTMRHGMPDWLGILAGTFLGMLTSIVLSIPLARLRGVFQAIATISFMQIVMSVTLYADGLTGGAIGIYGIPKLVSTGTLIIVVAALIWLLSLINASSIGRAFDVIREDETVAVSLGVSIVKYHTIAFALSGAIAGLAGALLTYNTRAIDPQQFGFSLMVTALAMVVMGGRVSVWGPVVGASVLTLLPELIRAFADQRSVTYGALLMIVIIYLPDGIVDTLKARWLRLSQKERAPMLGPDQLEAGDT
jgi:branched-chain amino acid transport system permease protein